MDSIDIVKEAYKVLDEKQAEDIKVLSVREQSSLADYFIISTAMSKRQAVAISENVEYKLEKLGIMPKSIEGLSTGGWILMDYYDVIIHIFTKDEREFYALDRLWQDAEILEESELK